MTYPEIEVNRAHHGMTHHRSNPEKIEDIIKINRRSAPSGNLPTLSTSCRRSRRAAVTCSTT